MQLNLQVNITQKRVNQTLHTQILNRTIDNTWLASDVILSTIAKQTPPCWRYT